jgi:dTDP-4-amino-4,6-dideoxygalactose transaminase
MRNALAPARAAKLPASRTLHWLPSARGLGPGSARTPELDVVANSPSASVGTALVLGPGQATGTRRAFGALVTTESEVGYRRAVGLVRSERDRFVGTQISGRQGKRVIPISVVRLGPEAERLAVEVIRSGMIAQGPTVARFERLFAELVGVRHAIAVNNGTTALVAAMQVLDLEPGDEVLTSPFTFAASLNAILEAGATARFADVSEDDFCVDPSAVEAIISGRTRVLMPVHLYGQPADMSRLAPLATRHALDLVEDAAQAHGAAVGGRAVGTFGLGCFSFYGTKNLTTGEGGMITTDDDTIADRLRVLRNQGMRQRYAYEVPGHNYRLTDLQAALAIPQLTDYAAQVARRQHNAERLSAGLADIAGLRTPRQIAGRHHVWHQYTLLLTGEAPVDRDELATRLTERGVGSGVYYPRLVFDYDCYRNHPRVQIDPTPVALSVARRCLSIPVHQHLGDAEVDEIITAVREVMKA